MLSQGVGAPGHEQPSGAYYPLDLLLTTASEPAFDARFWRRRLDGRAIVADWFGESLSQPDRG